MQHVDVAFRPQSPTSTHNQLSLQKSRRILFYRLLAVHRSATTSGGARVPLLAAQTAARTSLGQRTRLRLPVQRGLGPYRTIIMLLS
jgi:hypothetical protein